MRTILVTGDFMQGKNGGLINRLIMGKEKSEGYARASLPSNRWELWWDLFKGNLSKLFLLNLLIAVFFVPLFVLIYVMGNATAVYGSMGEFSRNVGIGYPAIPDMTGISETIAVTVNRNYLLFLPLTMLVASVGLSGGAFVMRNIVWTEGIFLMSDFWHGVKENYLKTMVVTLIFSVIFYLTQLAVSYSDFLVAIGEANATLMNIAKAFTYILCAFFFIATLWAVVINVTYELSLGALIKNALVMSLGLILRNVIFVALSLIPFVLYYVGGMLSMISVLIILLIGFSWALLILTDYAQWAFDKFVNDKIAGAKKNRGIYQKVTKEQAEKAYKEEINKARARSTLTNRPIKPITDEDLTLAELPEMYSREDLKRLQESREALYKDNEEYIKAHQNDERYDFTNVTDEEKEREERKKNARLALEGKKVQKNKKKKGKK